MARDRKRQQDTDLQERVVYIHRVSKTVKGGRRMSLVAIVVVGDGKGNVGLGMGRSTEVPLAIQKGVEDAKKNMFKVPVTAEGSVPHTVEGLRRWPRSHQAGYRGYRCHRRRPRPPALRARWHHQRSLQVPGHR